MILDSFIFGELISLSLSQDEFEDYIVLTTEYYWHWDLKSAKLDVLNIKNDAKINV